MPHPAKTLRIAAAATLIAGIATLTADASAVSLRVQLACATDYYAYCSQHNPNGPGVRACMNANGNKLSKRCVDALVAAGEISKAHVQRRAASK